MNKRQKAEKSRAAHLRQKELSKLNRRKEKISLMAVTIGGLMDTLNIMATGKRIKRPTVFNLKWYKWELLNALLDRLDK